MVVSSPSGDLRKCYKQVTFRKHRIILSLHKSAARNSRHFLGNSEVVYRQRAKKNGILVYRDWYYTGVKDRIKSFESADYKQQVKSMCIMNTIMKMCLLLLILSEV